jgi:hypothetical protein
MNPFFFTVNPIMIPKALPNTETLSSKPYLKTYTLKPV